MDSKESKPVGQRRNNSIILCTFCINPYNTSVKILVITFAELIRYLLRFSQICNWSQHRPMESNLKDFQTAFLRGHNTHIARSIFFSWISTANLQKCLLLLKFQQITHIHPSITLVPHIAYFQSSVSFTNTPCRVIGSPLTMYPHWYAQSTENTYLFHIRNKTDILTSKSKILNKFHIKLIC